MPWSCHTKWFKSLKNSFWKIDIESWKLVSECESCLSLYTHCTQWASVDPGGGASWIWLESFRYWTHLMLHSYIKWLEVTKIIYFQWELSISSDRSDRYLLVSRSGRVQKHDTVKKLEFYINRWILYTNAWNARKLIYCQEGCLLCHPVIHIITITIISIH